MTMTYSDLFFLIYLFRSKKRHFFYTFFTFLFNHPDSQSISVILLSLSCHRGGFYLHNWMKKCQSDVKTNDDFLNELILVLTEEWRCLASDPPAEEKYLYHQRVKHSISVLIDQKIESRQLRFTSFLGCQCFTRQYLCQHVELLN